MYCSTKFSQIKINTYFIIWKRNTYFPYRYYRRNDWPSNILYFRELTTQTKNCLYHLFLQDLKNGLPGSGLNLHSGSEEMGERTWSKIWRWLLGSFDYIGPFKNKLELIRDIYNSRFYIRILYIFQWFQKCFFCCCWKSL